MELVIDISETGEMTSLYNDILSDFDNLSISRASNVEFSSDIQKWIVEMDSDFFPKACLINTFRNRKDALAAEVDYLNQFILEM